MTKKKNESILVALCVLVYFISYVTRINYQAIISEIVSAEGISKDIASFAVTGLFITYGVGQIICGILGDKIKPQNIILTGLMVTTVMNVMLPVSTNVVYMTTIWCVNGVAQAMMWPPLVKILSTYLDDYAYSKAIVKVSYGSSVATIAIYLLSSLFAALHNWRMLFYTSALIGVVGIFLWKTGFSKVEKAMNAVERTIISDDNTETKEFKLSNWIVVIIGVMLAILLQGSLRDGVTTWIPSLINEIYGIDTSSAIVTSIALPIFSMLCYQIAQLLLRKYFKNEIVCAGVIFGTVFLATVLLWLFYDKSVIVTVLLNMIIVGGVHGVNLLLVCIAPKRFKPYGNISTMSGILNFSTYVGSAASTYGFAALSEYTGWHTTIGIWIGIALIGTLLCFLSAKKWSKL